MRALKKGDNNGTFAVSKVERYRNDTRTAPFVSIENLSDCLLARPHEYLSKIGLHPICAQNTGYELIEFQKLCLSGQPYGDLFTSQRKLQNPLYLTNSKVCLEAGNGNVIVNSQ